MLNEERFRDLVAHESGMRTVLRCVGNIYGCLIALRHWAYDHRWLRQRKAAVPVISVGNIVVGGTGKTPLVHLLAQELSTFAKIAILSRGYRSKNEHAKATPVTSSALPEECGDEPRLLAEKLPSALVLVGKDRHISAKCAVSQGVDLILLDDGMQHRRLARDFEVVVMDALDPFGQGFFLPGGLLRDSPKRLKAAHLIVATNIQSKDQYEEMRKKISLYSNAPLVGMQLRAEEEADFLCGKKIGLFCAIGNPNRFKATVEHLQGYVVESLIGNDHTHFSRKQLELFAKQCREKGAELLVCTEKDWVKLPAELKSMLPIYPIRVGLTVVAGGEYWRHFIEKIKEKL